jgi:Spy/CpxP family protein refolding chaperone
MTMLVTWISPLRSIAACTLALALAPLCASAQRPHGGQGAPVDRTMRRQERREAKQDIRREMKGKPVDGNPDGPPDGRRQPGRGAVIGRALGLLSLSPEQRKALRQIRARSDERMRQHGRRVLDLRREIDSSLFGPTFSMPVAREKGRELAAIIGERTTERTNVELAVFETLTPSQRSEVRAARDAQRARMRDAVRDRLAEPRDRPPDTEGVQEEGPPDVDAPEELDGDPPPPESVAAPGAGIRPRANRPAGMPEMLRDLGVTPDQLRRLRQLRRQQGPKMRQTSFRFRELQAQIDELLLADAIESAKLRDLAVQLGQADADRELARFESEAGIREILTAEQAAAFRERRRRQWNEGRGPEHEQGPPLEAPPGN